MITRRRPSIDTQVERSIITGMIVSDRFLSELQSIYRPNILRGNWVNQIASWIMEYWERYKKSPKSEIQDIFNRKKESELSPEQSGVIEEFLASISHEYETGNKYNVDYYLDRAEEHFQLSALENARFELSKCIAGKRIADGHNLIANFQEVSKVKIQGIDPFSSDSIIKALDVNSGDRLFRFHGVLGNSIGDLERGFLLGIVAEQGIGKTWWLIYIALRGLFSGYKVLFVSAEMSEKQITRRIQHWVTGLPTKRYLTKHNGKILIPIWDCAKNQTGKCDKCELPLIESDDIDEYEYKQPYFFDSPEGYKPCIECIGKKEFIPTTWYNAKDGKELNIPNALKKGSAVDKLTAVKSKRLKIVEFPSGKITVKQFETYLENLAYYEGFVPDIICTDYADKFKRSEREYRHGIGEIWEAHKAWAQDKHCLVATASQSNTARTGKSIKRGDWAEDIRKLGLIDVGFAINQTPEEKRRHLYRCGVVKQRHDEFDLVGEIYVTNALHIGRPYVSSLKIF